MPILCALRCDEGRDDEHDREDEDGDFEVTAVEETACYKARNED